MTIEKVPDMLGMIEFKDTEAHLHTWYKGIDDDMNEAVRMAIEALKAEPCEDCISRSSIKQKLQEHHDFFVDAYGGFSNLPQNDKARVDEITNCIAMVVNEPSVNPQRTGRWIETAQGDHYKCSCCGVRSAFWFDEENSSSWEKDISEWLSDYCPNCGAKMVEPQAESEDKE